MNKIKILKGIEKICVAGLITGASLMFVGGAKKVDNVKAIGGGVLAVSIAGAVYTFNKGNEYKKYLYEEEKNLYYKK